MSSTDRGQCACVPAQRANVAGLASSVRWLRSPTNALHSPSMSSTDRGQCACVPAQRANVAGLASSARCARPQMLCILLVCLLGERSEPVLVNSMAILFVCMYVCLLGERSEPVLVNSMTILFVCMYVCMYVYWASAASPY